MSKRFKPDHNSHVAFLCSALASSIVLVNQAYASMPDAGVTITNTAYASYIMPDGGYIQNFPSNTVGVTITPLYVIGLTTPAIQEVDAGSKVIWLNELSNHSNTSVDVLFDRLNHPELSNLKVYLDSNQNGQFDITDLVVSDKISLKKDEKVNLWVVADTSASLKDKHQVDLPLRAYTVQDPTVDAEATDSLISYIPQLIATKTVDQQTFQPLSGQSYDLKYRLEVKNNSAKISGTTTVDIDGTVISAVLLVDELPANTTFKSAKPANSNAIVLYKIGQNKYSKQIPTDQTSINELVVAYPQALAGNATESVELIVTMNANIANTTLVNRFSIEHATSTGIKKTISNDAITQVDGQAQVLNNTGDYSKIIATGSLKKPLYISSNSAVCNASRTSLDKVNIRVYSSTTGDIEDVVGIETGLNSGIFRFELPTEENVTAQLNDQNLQTVKRDKVIVSLTDCLDENHLSTKKIDGVSTDVLIDPYGIVFDAKTGLPVAGATVTLRDRNGQPVGPNIAFRQDEMTGQLISIPATQVTDSEGQFVYPLVEPGTYSLHVDTSTIPGGINYTFSSDKTIYTNFGQRPVHQDWSYGGNFVLNIGDAALNVDIPIDPLNVLPPSVEKLMVKKELVGSKNAEIGDFKDYIVTVANKGTSTVYDVDMKDTLPRGLVYVSGTSRIDNQKAADPEGKQGPYLTFGLGELAPTQEKKIQYRVYIGPTALAGDGINRAFAQDSKGFRSNEAQAKLNITPSVFSPDGFVVGKVFTDCNRNGIQDKGETGVPGIRLYMEDGSFVVTDREGKYNFYGVSPITHVLKLDKTTLPANAEMLLINNRQAGDPGSRFVDIKRGELHRADFAITDGLESCSQSLLDQVDERKQSIDTQLDALEQVLRADLSLEPTTNYVSDLKGQPSSGCISSIGASANCNVEYKKDALREITTVQIEPIKAFPVLDLEQELQRSEPAQLRILNLKDQQVLPAAQTTIQLKGIYGTDIQLFVNDVRVDEKRIGKKAVSSDLGVAGFDFIGVALKPGSNQLEARQYDGWGNLRDSHKMTVIAPGNISKLDTQIVEQNVYANGKDIFQVVVKITDQEGTPIASRTPLTVESSIGIVQLEDLDPNKPGIQIFVEGGSVVIPVLAPTQAGEGVLKVSSGIYEVTTPVRFLAELRPMLVAGIIEGSFTLRDVNPKNLLSTSIQDGFEDELNELSSSEDGRNSLQGRAALFLKGKVRGDYLLTLAYDSAKSNNQRLFRDIRPDEYYPVYGDASAKGFDAQSTSKLYVRVDKGRSYAMYGDYVTRTENDEGLSLGQYSRSLTGLKSTFETERSKITGFASRTNTTQVVNELRAMGVSGPYSLGISVNDIQENSEKVEVIVRDRNNPGLIISQRNLNRFSDYEVDTYSNSIYLTTPLSSIDENLNPVSLRVTVETDQGGEEYTVAGVNGYLKLTDKAQVGASYVQNDDPIDEEKIASLNTVVKLSENTKLVAEYAYSENTSNLDSLINVNASANDLMQDQGSAGRIELDHKYKNIELRAYHHQADEGFKNPSSSITAGRKESAIKLNARLDRVGTIRLETLRTEDTANLGVRTGVSASIERAINHILSAEVGVRYYDESVEAASESSSNINTPYNGTTIRSKLKANLPFNSSSVFAEYEQDVSDSERQVFALGADTKIAKNIHAYARHELISSIGGVYELNDVQSRNTTVFGIDSEYMRDGSIFSEYRVRDGMSSREAEAAMGVRNRWQLNEGIFFNTSFEKVKVIEGENKASLESTAATLGVEHLSNPKWKNVARLEGRWSDQTDHYLNTLGTAYKLNNEITLLAKNILNLTENKAPDSGDRLVNRFQVGAAYRDVQTNRFDVLTKIEHRYEENKTNVKDPYKRNAYIFSNHVNYHPIRSVHLSGQYAVKYLKEEYDFISTSGMTQMLNTRFIYDINERWDAGLNTGVMWSNISDGTRYLAGVEVGYLLAANLWVSGGYNFIGYEDKDLTQGDTTVEGAYFRLRFKFDENLFNGKNRLVNKSLEPK